MDTSIEGVVVIRVSFLLGILVIVGGIVCVASAEDGIPSGPRDLEVVAGDEHVNLTWSPPTDAGTYNITNYWVYWLPDPSFGGIRWEPTTNITYWTGTSVHGNVTTFNHTGLINGVHYWYHIRARTGEVEGEPSNIAGAIPKRLPSAPWGLWAKEGEEEVYLSWEPPDITGDAIITDYRVLRGRTKGEMEVIATLSWRWHDWNLYTLPPTNFTDQDLQGRKVWYYQVIAVNTMGEGPPSPPLLVGEADLAPVVPSIPGGLRARVTNGYINLSWVAPGYDGGMWIIKYTIYRWTDGEEPEAIGEVPYQYLEFLDVRVDEAVEYHYAVTAWNTVGESAQSLEVTATVHPSGVEDPAVPSPDGKDDGSDLVREPILLMVAITLLIVAILLLYVLFASTRGRNRAD